jgi:hypothetical protein
MKRIARLVALVLPLVLVASNSSAAVKPGAACKKVGQITTVSGKKYTCVKKGKALVWSVSKKVVQPTPQVSAIPTPSPSPSASPMPIATPTPSPTPTFIKFDPWAPKFEANAMITAAQRETDLYFGKVTPSSDYELNIDPAITASDKEWITKSLDYVNGAFSSIKQNKVKVFLGTTHQWSRETLRSKGLWIGDPGSPYPCSQGLNDAYCASDDQVLLVFSDIYKPNSQFQWDSGRKSTPAHEMFHVAQYWLYGAMGNVSPSDPRGIPTWLKEGSANYFGFYINESVGIGYYINGRNQQVRNNTAYRVKIPLVEYVSYGGMSSGVQLDPYGIGQAATEYIIASVGFSRLLNIFKFAKEDGNFASGFKRATQIELSDFYAKFEAARGSMQIGE